MIRRMLLFALAAVYVLYAQSGPSDGKLLTSTLASQVEEAIRWYYFWNAKPDWVHYSAGHQGQVSMTQAPGALTILVPDAGIRVEFIEEKGSYRVNTIDALKAVIDDSRSILEPNEQGTTGLDSCVTATRGVPGSAYGATLPNARLCGEALKPSGPVQIYSLKLPTLLPPIAIRDPSKSVDVSSILRLARTHFKGYTCAVKQVIMPRAGSSDPMVYVYIQYAEKCQSGLLVIRRAPQGWEESSFVADIPINDLKDTIDKVKKFSVTSLP